MKSVPVKHQPWCQCSSMAHTTHALLVAIQCAHADVDVHTMFRFVPVLCCKIIIVELAFRPLPVRLRFASK